MFIGKLNENMYVEQKYMYVPFMYTLCMIRVCNTNWYIDSHKST